MHVPFKYYSIALCGSSFAQNLGKQQRAEGVNYGLVA